MPDRTPEFAEIQRSLGRVEGKQDAILSRLSHVDRDLVDHNKRLGELEKRMAQRAGIIGFLSGLFASIAAIVGQKWMGQ